MRIKFTGVKFYVLNEERSTGYYIVYQTQRLRIVSVYLPFWDAVDLVFTWQTPTRCFDMFVVTTRGKVNVSHSSLSSTSSDVHLRHYTQQDPPQPPVENNQAHSLRYLSKAFNAPGPLPTSSLLCPFTVNCLSQHDPLS